MDRRYAEISFPKRYINEELHKLIDEYIEEKDEPFDGRVFCGRSYKAHDGMFEEIEEYLQKHKIPFDRITEAVRGDPEKIYIYRPDEDIDDCYPTDFSCDTDELKKLVNNTSDTALRVAILEFIELYNPDYTEIEDC